MAGFRTIVYLTNNENTFKCKVEDDDDVLAFIAPLVVAPAGGLTEDMSVRISKNDREAGIQPRYVTLSRTLGEEGEETANGLVNSGKAYRRVIIPTLARWNAIVDGLEVTIDGITYTVATKSSEDIE